ncbi:uncharacterized protein LOC131877855 [Tigriopus californicus]|uniref:uncharacterized protein LOC131877855 n=1 Tax=Tigriopus californicus TaxID=6832 RepID=UPI0027D9FF7D|nr:uncharacterized protein LOC131877855 [Tigriopus californicus]XP_059079653.1 uncharacterized protein LOC131877855 [Tigriopus californicus]XP_059079654.1 uncharacterized protein LOC131877855 [Tigriopus californicus]
MEPAGCSVPPGMGQERAASNRSPNNPPSSPYREGGQYLSESECISELNGSGSIHLSDKEELADLSEEEETKTGDKFAKLTVNNPKTNPQSYVLVASKVRGHEVIYVHLGQKERSPLGRELFYKLWDKLQEGVVELLLKGETPPTNVLCHSWSQQRVLIAVGDEETSKAIIQLIAQMSIKQLKFRAWKRGEFGEGRLVTAFFAGNSLKLWGGDKLLKLLKSQNKLLGNHVGVKTTDTDKGRKMIFFADPILWKDLKGRATPLAQHKVVLRLGLAQYVFHLSQKSNVNAAPEDTPSLEREEKKSETGEPSGGDDRCEAVTARKAHVLADAPVLVEVGDETEAVSATAEIPASEEGGEQAGSDWKVVAISRRKSPLEQGSSSKLSKGQS